MLSIVNLTEILFGKGSDLLEDYISYKSLDIHSILEENRTKIETIVLDCISFRMSGYGILNTKNNSLDMLIFITPFKTVKRILSKIPVVNYIMNDSLISIPFKLEGKLGQIKVKPASVNTLRLLHGSVISPSCSFEI